jgi:hypothetical protein
VTRVCDAIVAHCRLISLSRRRRRRSRSRSLQDSEHRRYQDGSVETTQPEDRARSHLTGNMRIVWTTSNINSKHVFTREGTSMSKSGHITPKHDHIFGEQIHQQARNSPGEFGHENYLNSTVHLHRIDSSLTSLTLLPIDQTTASNQPLMPVHLPAQRNLVTHTRTH